MAPGMGLKAAMTFANFAAAVHRTLQDRSSMVATTSGSNLLTKAVSCAVKGPSSEVANSPMTRPKTTKFCAVCRRTES